MSATPTTSAFATSLFERWAVYFAEMYPPVQRLVMAGVLFIGPYFALTLLSPDHPTQPVFNQPAVAGWLTYFFFLLLLRVSDEFKDFELDCRLFPERPLPSGRVLPGDLRILGALCVAVLVLLNTLVAPLTVGFVTILGYAALMLKFFFIKERIQKSLLLALVTHNPVIFLMTLYTSSLVSAQFGSSALSWTFLKVGVLFALPGLIWELSRKIKAPQDENEYETYSKVFGYKLAALLPVGLYAAHFALTLELAKDLALSMPYLVALGLGALLASGASLRFLARPNAMTSRLRPPAEIYATLASLGFIVDLSWARGIAWHL